MEKVHPLAKILTIELSLCLKIRSDLVAMITGGPALDDSSPGYV